ncbi:MAG: hypothetical protein ACRDE7_03300 [Sphingobacterium sp.]
MIKFVPGMQIGIMKVKEIRNEQGIRSGIPIPADDIKELKKSLKAASKFYDYFQSDKKVEKRNLDELMSNELPVTEANERTTRLTEEIHKKAFSKCVPMSYRDKRAKVPKEFLRSKPGGSEELVK